MTVDETKGVRGSSASFGGSRLRSLHLPFNYASVMSHQVRAERSLGIDASGISYGEQSAITSPYGIRVESRPRRREVWKWPAFLRRLESEVRQVDVVHWYFALHVAPLRLDTRAVRNEGVPGFVEMLGSDIRDPAVEMKDNPWYAHAWEHGYEYRDTESTERCMSAQADFEADGFRPIVTNGTLQYLTTDSAAKAVLLERAVLPDEFRPAPPDPSVDRPLVVHAPSAPVCKGTAYIEDALERLRSDLPFEYVRVENMPRPEALEVIGRADVFIDQVVLGDYGMAAIEAMAMGKPVVAWVKPAVRDNYPAELPVVNADPSQLVDVLGQLLCDGRQRHETGLLSRSFVEAHHDSYKRAEMLLPHYEEAAPAGQRRGRATP